MSTHEGGSSRREVLMNKAYECFQKAAEIMLVSPLSLSLSLSVIAFTPPAG
jgi:DNA anti-recombination protein RmuC